MKIFILRFLTFFSIVLILPLINFILDPIDLYDHPFKIPFNRIEKTRIFNTADWTLSELNKIDLKEKNKATIITIGDSRGQSLVTNGFKGGWKKRIIKIENEIVYDISFGGAQLEEMKSLLNQELRNCPKVKKVYFVIGIDRFIEIPKLEDRILSSQLKGSYPNISYLMNPSHIITFVKACLEKTGNQMTNKNRKDKIQKIENNIIEKYEEGQLSNIDRSLKRFSTFTNQIKKGSDIKLYLILPPYEPQFLKKIKLKYDNLYSYEYKKLAANNIKYINLQENVELFQFKDPVHGQYLNKNYISKLFFESN